MARCFFLISLLSAILLLTQSCMNKSGKVNISNIEIQWVNDDELLNINEYFNIDTIMLETSPSCLIGNVNKVQFVDDKIVVYDSRASQLLVFSPMGEFRNRIGNKGQGPQEYTGIHDFFIKNNKAYIYDFNQKKILEFTLDGDYLSSISLNDIPHFDKIIPLKRGGYVSLNTYSNASECPKFSWLDDNFKLKAKSNVQRLNGTSLNNVFYNSGDSLVYWEMMNDTIYYLKDGDVNPLYKIDFNSRSIPENLEGINEKIEYYSKFSSSTACFVNNVINTDKFLSFTFAHNLYTNWTIWDKRGKRMFRFKLARVGEWHCLQDVIAYNDSVFLGVFLPDHSISDNNPYLLKLKFRDDVLFNETN